MGEEEGGVVGGSEGRGITSYDSLPRPAVFSHLNKFNKPVLSWQPRPRQVL